MNGLRTAIILGAGASYCYEDGTSNIPMQKDIIGRLFMGIRMSPGLKVGAFSGPEGLKYSESLAGYLKGKFDIPEEQDEQFGALGYWKILQKRGCTLETLYAELEQDNQLPSAFREDFEAIIRTAVREPTSDRGPDRVCRYHAKLCDALEPGDFIVNFNWDSLMADALLYRSFFWFPATGFGYPSVTPLVKLRQKQSLQVNSLVLLLQVHGSVVLFETSVVDGQKKSRAVLYLGPNCYSNVDSLLAASGIDLTRVEPGSPELKRELSEDEHRRILLGHIYLEKPFLQKGKWFSPIFTPPSSFKNAQSHWYIQRIKKHLHARLSFTEQIVVAGYSFPSADAEHLSFLFPKEIMDPALKLVIVNPSVRDPDFLSTVKTYFPGNLAEENLWEDFKEFCSNI